jgi:hypothetical protein
MPLVRKVTDTNDTNAIGVGEVSQGCVVPHLPLYKLCETPPQCTVTGVFVGKPLREEVVVQQRERGDGLQPTQLTQGISDTVHVNRS